MRFKPLVLSIVLVCLAAVALPGLARCAESDATQGERIGYPVLGSAKLDKLLKEQGKNKVVIVSFFASWCPPCRKEIPQLVHLRSKVAEGDMLILGVSADEDMEELSKFLVRAKINFPIYLGTDDLFIKHEVSSIPKMVIYNSKGEVFQVVEGLLPEATFNGMIDYLLGNAYE
ncbi:TlpA family protein disulfide reductase [Desulfovibrio sp. OttesenSCG-928-C06]|nr:TlpA family protein disulfide reductase [Desulfovibrio sp. OttesenSCG-928-C06]